MSRSNSKIGWRSTPFRRRQLTFSVGNQTCHRGLVPSFHPQQSLTPFTSSSSSSSDSLPHLSQTSLSLALDRSQNSSARNVLPAPLSSNVHPLFHLTTVSFY